VKGLVRIHPKKGLIDSDGLPVALQRPALSVDGSSMRPDHPFDELLAYVGFTGTDTVALQAARSTVGPHTGAVTDRFYDNVLRFEGARSVFANDAQVQRLKNSLVDWLKELFTGPHDHAYHARRLAIGKAHVRVRLPSRYMFTAMSGVRVHLRELLRGHDDACAALDKILDVELAIMTGTTGWFHAKQLGFLDTPWPQYGWVLAALIIITILTVQGLGLLLPTNVRVYLELRKPAPDRERIGRLLKSYVYLVGFQGMMQVAMIVVMAKFVTGL
jgi:hypothetical protein